jgi:hypothetical protein
LACLLVVLVCYHPFPGMWSVRSALTAALVMLSFLVVAGIQSWPLPRHFETHLTGDPSGDTGVYVWNTWVFRHELLVQRNSPFDTDTILSMGGLADLSLHNYTVFTNLLTLPIQPWLGVVGAFNVVYLVNFALTGLGMFLLVGRLTRTAPVPPVVAWLAAFLFACSPFLVARGNGHYSVASAAALPFFLLCASRALDSRTRLDAAAAGACLAWAGYSDPYYAVYCVLLGVGIVLARIADVRPAPRSGPPPRVLRALDVLAVAVVAAAVLIRGLGGGVITVGSLTVSMRSMYTPMLVLTVLITVRVLLTIRPRVHWTWTPLRGMAVPGMVTVAVAAALLAPQIVAVGIRASEGRMVTAPVLWRSSAPGVDVAALLLPNPNHPLTPAGLVDWVKRQPGENIVSLPWVALLTLVAAWRWAGYRADRAWLATALVFLSLSFGPFIRIAGFETLVPTPWTLARYLPLIGEARMPSRMSVLVILALSVLFAGALAALMRRRRSAAVLVGVTLAFELLAAPRTLYPASVPGVFDVVARDPRHVRVLAVPTGIKDGLDTLGSFDATALFYQTAHHKPLVAGYLSRISDQRKALYRDHPVLGPLIAESEGRVSTPAERQQARESARAFLDENNIGWVMIDEGKASKSLQQLTIDALRLRLQERSGRYALYAPADANEP